VLWGASGRVITAEKLVGFEEQVRIEFRDGSERPASVLRRDSEMNLAILLVEGPLPRCANPILGPASPMTHEGILFCRSWEGPISDFRIHLPLQDHGLKIHARLPLMADGGLITDLSGKPMGIATLMGPGFSVSPSGPGRTHPNYGYTFRAVPANLFSEERMDLSRKDTLEEHTTFPSSPSRVASSDYQPWLGASVQKLDEEMAQTLGVSGKGMLVVSVREHGPAFAGGVRRGDVILEADGRSIHGAGDLKAILQELIPGESVSFQVVDGENRTPRTLTVTRPQ